MAPTLMFLAVGEGVQDGRRDGVHGSGRAEWAGRAPQ